MGITNIHYEETQVQRALISCAGEVIAPASSEKLGTAAPFLFGPIGEINLIVTDKNVNMGALSAYQAYGIEVIQA